MTSGVTPAIQQMYDLEDLAAHIARAQDHLRVASTKHANRRTMTLDDADVADEINQARGCLVEAIKAIAEIHPKGHAAS